MDRGIGEQLGDVARAMSAEPGPGPTLDTAVAAAVDLIHGCDHAGIFLLHKRGEIETAAATDDVARIGDKLQDELGEGPCLQAITEQETVYASDLGTESRWPSWSRRVHDELRISSLLALQLFVTDRTIGALNLYSRTPEAFDHDDRASAHALASHVAVAMTAAFNEHQLYLALSSRLAIGQAEGMMMQRYGLSAEEAFSVLRRASQHGNRKLVDICREIVARGPEVLEQG